MYSQYKLKSGCMGQGRILGHVFPIGIAAHFAEVNEIVTNLLKEGKPANSIGRIYSFSLVNYMTILMRLELFRF